MPNFNSWLIESSLSRIHASISKHSAGAITAWRNENTRAENQSLNKKLLAYLTKNGYSITSVKGSYIENFKSGTEKEVGEHTFFVVNRAVDGDDGGKLESELIKLGKLFDQDSILTIRGGVGTLVGTSQREDSFPGYGVRLKAGTGKYGYASGAFFSRVRGRKFAFESVTEISNQPSTINGVRARDILAEEVRIELQKLD